MNCDFKMDSSAKRKLIGLVLLIVGLTFGLRYSGTTSGFHANDLDAMLYGIAYIGGFVLAFIGAVMIFYREKKERSV